MTLNQMVLERKGIKMLKQRDQLGDWERQVPRLKKEFSLLERFFPSPPPPHNTHPTDTSGGGGGHMMRSPQGGLSMGKDARKVVMWGYRGNDPASGHHFEHFWWNTGSR